MRRLVEEGQILTAVVTAVGLCERTLRKWVGRFRAKGSEGLQECERARVQKASSGITAVFRAIYPTSNALTPLFSRDD